MAQPPPTADCADVLPTIGRFGYQPEEPAMSLILRIVFVLAGLIAALFVARDTVNFELVQTWLSIALVALVLGIGSVWLFLRRKA
jgi:hypothetical protein